LKDATPEEANPRLARHSVPTSRSAKVSAESKSRNGKPAEVLDLSRLAIGTRLRHARLIRGARLIEVAEAAGCSESLVSKIENNKLQPSLQTLHKLCSVLKIGLGELFSPQQDDYPVVTRQGRRTVIEVDPLRRGEGILMERVNPLCEGPPASKQYPCRRTWRCEFRSDFA
jgi:transcriptional regulator with XRE-family HTH domain